MIADAKEARTLIADLREKNERVLGEQILESQRGASGTLAGGLIPTDMAKSSEQIRYRTVPVCAPLCPALDLPEIVFVDILQNPTCQVATELAWGDDENQAQSRKDDFDQHFTSLPNDFEHFDFAESEQRINDIVHTTDAWTCPVIREGVPVANGGLSDRQQKIDSCWAAHSSLVGEGLHSYVANWMNSQSTEKNETFDADAIRQALIYLQEHGSGRDRGLASSSLDRLGRMPSAVGRCTFLTEIVWGGKTQLIDCESEELSFGVLRFHVLDFGDVLDLNTGLQHELACGDAVERNQCAWLAMADGAEWSLQKRPQRPPSRSHVQFAAREMRGEEISVARLVPESMSRAMRSATHDVLSVGHGRDIRCFSWFVIPAARKYAQCEIRAVEISRNLRMSVAHVFPCVAETSEALFFVACRGHLRWMMPTMYSRPKEWKHRRASFSRAVQQPAESWNDFHARYVEEEPPPYKPCAHCPSWLKVDINDWCVGGGDLNANSQPSGPPLNRQFTLLDGSRIEANQMRQKEPPHGTPFQPPGTLHPDRPTNLVNGIRNASIPESSRQQSETPQQRVTPALEKRQPRFTNGMEVSPPTKYDGAGTWNAECARPTSRFASREAYACENEGWQ